VYIKLNVWDPYCADANLKLVINISISLGGIIKETISGEVIRCLPPVSYFLKSFTFCRNLCYEVTSFKSTKSSKILTLAQIIDPFNADANLKYEHCNFNSYLDKLKRDAPIEVELSRTSIGATHSWHVFWLGFVLLPYLRCHGPINSVPGHIGLVPPFSQFSRSVLLVHSAETNNNVK
jgi:hypothetical protein